MKIKDSSPITLFGSGLISSLKLVISSKPENGIPYSIILPLQDTNETYTFLIDNSSMEDFNLQFDIYPTFGTKVIGRAVALPEMLGLKNSNVRGDIVKLNCPLFDLGLRVVGELNFECVLVKSFVHPYLEIGGKIDTYWKSTMTRVPTIATVPPTSSHPTLAVKDPNSSHTGAVSSFVTASSLSEEYLRISIHFTSDGVPICTSSPFVTLPLNGDSIAGISVSILDLKYNQIRDIFGEKDARLKEVTKASMKELVGLINASCLSLSEVLQVRKKK